MSEFDPLTSSTRFKPILREFGGQLTREVRLALTAVPQPEKWLFVVGCYNSGTTLLAELLGRHPKIAALPTEGQFITDELIKDYELGLPRMWVAREDMFRMNEYSTGPNVRRLKKEWGLRLDTSKPILLEKSPPNAARTRWLQDNFDDSHFVAIVRNGYAVSEGIRRKAQPWHQPDSKWPIEMAARQWARSNQVLIEDSAHLSNVIWITYEDLVTDSQRTLRAVTDFLEVEWSTTVSPEEPVSIHERSETLSDHNTMSIDRLSRADIASISAVAGPMLRHFGYALLSDSSADSIA